VASLTIVTRRGKHGPRYLVRYRLGGRAYPIVHAGSFKTLKEAKARRDFVAGELAAGRNPAEALRALSAAPTAIVSVNTWAARFVASRIHVDTNTIKNYRSALRKIGETFGDRDPATITATEIAEWIATMAETRKPGTLGQCLIAFRLLLDHVGLEPNVARDPRVRLPKQVREKPQPPRRTLRGDRGGARGEVEASVRHGRAGCLTARRGGRVALGRHRRGRAAAAATTVGDEARQRALGVPARLADGGDRGNLPAGGSRPRATCVSGDQRGVRLPSDDTGVPQREGAALPPA
jgi:hypothetical protein